MRAAWRGLAGVSRHEILCRWVMDHYRRGTLLGLKQEPRCQAHTNVFFGMEQRKELRLIFEILAGGIFEAVARSAIHIHKLLRGIVVQVLSQPSFDFG